MSHRDAGPGRAGFTLVELMIVLAILGLAVGLALPLIGKRMPGAALGSAAQQVRAALGAARSASIAEDREVVFAGGDNSYRIDGERHALPADAGLRVEISGSARISFFPSGGASGGRVVLRGAAGRREIEVDRVTGRAILLP